MEASARNLNDVSGDITAVNNQTLVHTTPAPGSVYIPNKRDVSGELHNTVDTKFHVVKIVAKLYMCKIFMLRVRFVRRV